MPVAPPVADPDAQCAAALAFTEALIGAQPDAKAHLADTLARDRFLWLPNSGAQSAAFHSEAFETLYGGAAGGGKTDLLLGVARHNHRSAIIFRRISPDIERTLVVRSLQIYGDSKAYNATKRVWTFGGEQRVWFSHLQNPGDEFDHKSAQYDLVAFDELTEFNEAPYVYLISRVRTTRRGQACRVIGATNPGGIGNEWVMRRWAAWLDPAYPNRAAPGEVRWFRRDASGRDVECEAGHSDALSRTYIPAKLKDNPHIDPSYRRMLAAMDPVHRAQLLEGDWQAGLVDDAYQVFPRAWVKAAMARWRAEGGAGLEQARMAQDPSRGGADPTLVAELRGGWVRFWETPGSEVKDGPTAAGLVRDRWDGSCPVLVDVVGIGSSAFDSLLGGGVKARAFNGASSALGPDRTGRIKFVNRRVEGFWRLREALDPDSGLDVALPEDPELFAELMSIRYEEQASGIKMTPKDELREILGRSTNKADVVSMLFAEDEAEAFGAVALDVHRLEVEGLRVRPGERGAWELVMPWMGGGDDVRPGRLLRACWHTRRGEFHCLWVHDDEGSDGTGRCWTVFRAFSERGPLSRMAKAVASFSQEGREAHRYQCDVAAGDGPMPGYGEASFADTLGEEIRRVGRGLPAPDLVDGGSLKGVVGLDRLDAMLLGTLARFPEHRFWAGRGDESRLYEEGEMLVSVSAAVLRQLEEARFKALKGGKETDEIEAGGYVQCLRLLCMMAS